MEVTARLENWRVAKGFLVGNVYDDNAGRFEDGTLIRTSKIEPMSLQLEPPKEGSVILTRNSKYLLGVKFK